MSITVYHDANSALANLVQFGVALGDNARHNQAMDRYRKQANRNATYGQIAEVTSRTMQEWQRRRAMEEDRNYRDQQRQQERAWHQSMQDQRLAYGQQQSREAREYAGQQRDDARNYARQQAADDRQFGFDAQQAAERGFWREGSNAPQGAPVARGTGQLAGQAPWAPLPQGNNFVGPEPNTATQAASLQRAFESYQKEAGVEMVWSKSAKAELSRLNSEYQKVMSAQGLDEEEKAVAINQLASDLRNVHKVPQQKPPAPDELAAKRAIKDAQGNITHYLNEKGTPVANDIYEAQIKQAHEIKVDQAQDIAKRSAAIEKEAGESLQRFMDQQSNIDPDLINVETEASKVIKAAKEAGRYPRSASDFEILSGESTRLAIERAKATWWSQNPLTPQQVAATEKVFIDYITKAQMGAQVSTEERLTVEEAARQLQEHLDANSTPYDTYRSPLMRGLWQLSEQILGG